jgi:hypothetical protein
MIILVRHPTQKVDLVVDAARRVLFFKRDLVVLIQSQLFLLFGLHHLILLLHYHLNEFFLHGFFMRVDWLGLRLNCSGSN